MSEHIFFKKQEAHMEYEQEITKLLEYFFKIDRQIPLTSDLKDRMKTYCGFLLQQTLKPVNERVGSPHIMKDTLKSYLYDIDTALRVNDTGSAQRYISTLNLFLENEFHKYSEYLLH